MCIKYTLLFLLIFMLISIQQLQSQNENIEKWKACLSTYTENNEFNPDDILTCLIPINNQIIIRSKILSQINVLRVLDEEYVIGEITKNDFDILREAKIQICIANNIWKLSNILLKINDNDIQTVVIKASNIPALIDEISNANIRILKILNNLLIVKGKMKDIKTLFLNSSNVKYIGLESFTPKLESKISDLDHSFNRINRIHDSLPDINGSGTIVSIKDALYNINDLDLLGKHINSVLSSNTVNSHATDMATIVAGLGNSSAKGKGVAFSSSIISSDYNNIMPDSHEILSDLGVNVQNHSYGTEIENFYGVLAEAYDEITYLNPEIAHNFSSGNSGDSIPNNGFYAGLGTFANLTGNYKMAKNILTIGAVDYNNELLSFSSRGPAYDGRIKPELVAYSTVGTSNATAIVSGLSLLLQQQYKNIHDSTPLSSLIKAALINGANDVGISGPDFETGFGNVNGFESLLTIRNNRFIVDQVNKNETKTYTLTIPANSQNLKITMVWTDFPALANSNIALVNDLDIQIRDSAGKLWLPWVLDHSSNIENLTSPAIRSVDHLNNIEQITIDTIPHGSYYTIEVKGFNVTNLNQEFAIAYQWSTSDQFEWHYPTENDPITFDGEIGNYLKWKSTYNTNIGILQVSYDKGNSWLLIDSNVDLSKSSYLWIPENEVSSVATLKMIIDGNEYLSDEFVISNTTQLTVGLNCEEIIELSWNESSNVNNYNIYNLQGNLLAVISQTINTSFVFEKDKYNTPFFSVQPFFDNNHAANKSETINLNNYESSCYINSFYAINSLEEAIEINLELGSLYLMEDIEIYRLIQENLSIIETISQPNELSYQILDSSPLQGRNQYVAKIILNNGNEYISDIADTYFLTEKPFLVFPNPANNEGINIYTKNFNGDKVYFKLYSMEGKHIMTQKIISDRDFIKLNNLSKGIYLYHIESINGVKESSLLIIQ